MVGEWDFGKSIYPEADFCCSFTQMAVLPHGSQHRGAKLSSPVVTVKLPRHVPLLETEMN